MVNGMGSLLVISVVSVVVGIFCWVVWIKIAKKSEEESMKKQAQYNAEAFKRKEVIRLRDTQGSQNRTCAVTGTGSIL